MVRVRIMAAITFGARVVMTTRFSVQSGGMPTRVKS